MRTKRKMESITERVTELGFKIGFSWVEMFRAGLCNCSDGLPEHTYRCNWINNLFNQTLQTAYLEEKFLLGQIGLSFCCRQKPIKILRNCVCCFPSDWLTWNENHSLHNYKDMGREGGGTYSFLRQNTTKVERLGIFLFSVSVLFTTQLFFGLLPFYSHVSTARK